MGPKSKVSDTREERNSSGSEVSGGPVKREIHEQTADDGSKHTTESVQTESSSSRMSWDTSPSGENSNFHSNNN